MGSDDTMTKKRRVLLRAPLLTISGYGVHSRQIFEYLFYRDDIELTVELLNWGVTSWMINPAMEEGLIGKIMECSKELKPPYDLSVQIQLPDEWNHKLAHRNIGVSAFVECTSCNPTWVDKCNLMDMVIVPSTFIKNVVQKSGSLAAPIHVVPEWFNYSLLDDCSQESEMYQFEKKFNFLILGQLTGNKPDTDRKNTFNMVKWFCETFEGNTQVGLILKTNVGRCTLNDRNITLNVAKQLLREVRKGLFPKVTILHGNLSSREIAGLYQHKNVKCLLSATRGEGYGLPIIDAAAAAMPVIVTGWSGHMEFINKKYASILKYNLVKIPNDKIDNRIFIKGVSWANVDERDFKKKILEVYKNFKIKQQKADVLQKEVITKFRKEKVCKLYDNIIEKFLISG